MKCLWHLLFFLSSFSIFAQQDGPAGVGSTDGSSSLELWFDGRNINGDGTNPAFGAAVTSWADLSGNGRNVTQNTAGVATYANPGLTFNNIGYLQGSDAGLPTGNTTRDFYIVASTPNTSSEDVFFIYGTAAGNQSYGVSKLANEQIRSTFFANDLDVNTWNPTNTTRVVGVRYTQGANRSIFVDGLTNGTDGAPGNTPNTVLAGAQGLQIGGWSNFGLQSQATIKEVLLYSDDLRITKEILITNYLAAKYGSTLDIYDIYDEDEATNGNYDFDVAGIGRWDQFLPYLDARGSGIVRFNNPSDVDDREFLIWGNDGANLNFDNTLTVPSGKTVTRINRTWRVSEYRAEGNVPVDIGAVDITVDLSSEPTIDVGVVQLIVDTDNDGSFADEALIKGESLGNNLFRFPQVTAIANNCRFTFAKMNITKVITNRNVTPVVKY